MGSRASKWYATWLSLLGVACASGAGTRAGAPTTESAAEENAEAGPGAAAADEGERNIPHFAEGRQVGMVSRAEAQRRGLTILDLGDDWTPGVFNEDPSLGSRGRQPFRAQFLRLSNEEVARRRNDYDDRYLELFGIFPTFFVLRERLADEARHRCHDAIDDAAMETIESSLRPGADLPQQRRRANAVTYMRHRLEERARRMRLESIDLLESNRRWGTDLRQLRDLERALSGIHAVQAHLRCEGLLSSRADAGVLDAWTGRALRNWQSKNMIISLGGRLDDATRESLVSDTRELDLYSILRALRERVVDATGLLEDGSAVGEWNTIVDRRIDIDDEFRYAARLDPLPGGAPDLISQATDAAARALGWTDPAATLAFMNEHVSARQPQRLVAVQLPPTPAYHSEHMDLHVTIDRGDVFYSFPYTADGRPRGMAQNKRPIFVIYTRHEGRDIPLIRWNTTIGSWQPEVNPAGGLGMRYKESDVGPRLWRDVIASPSWLPPPSTPDSELMRSRGGEWFVNRSITGPGYDSAYGLAMVIHHLVRGDGATEEDWLDRGIRSHGSVSYRTILRGYSHGCHRLFNHLAVRMTSFLVRHRNHITHGRLPALFRRTLRPEGSTQTLTMEIDTRGYRYELTPPVPVEVLQGNIRGRQRRPLTAFFPLPEELQAAAREQLAADPGTGGAVAAPPTPTPTPAPAPAPAPRP